MVSRLRQATACPSMLTSENIPSAKVDRAVELTKRSLKQNKGFKKAIKADKIGTGVALTGAGLMAANHFLNKKKKKKDNE